MLPPAGRGPVPAPWDPERLDLLVRLGAGLQHEIDAARNESDTAERQLTALHPLPPVVDCGIEAIVREGAASDLEGSWHRIRGYRLPGPLPGAASRASTVRSAARARMARSTR